MAPSEKPLTTSTASSRELLLAAQRHRVVIYPCHNYKHAPVITTVKEIIDAGTIGEVTAATLATYRPTHAKGVKEWLTDRRRMRDHSGGGIAMDHGSHSFYLAHLFMGGYPTAVAAKAFTVDKKWDTENNVTAALLPEVAGVASQRVAAVRDEPPPGAVVVAAVAVDAGRAPARRGELGPALASGPGPNRQGPEEGGTRWAEVAPKATAGAAPPPARPARRRSNEARPPLAQRRTVSARRRLPSPRRRRARSSGRAGRGRYS